MSRPLQWVLGISVVVVATAIVFAMLAPWATSLLGWRNGFGMMGTGGMLGGGYGMMGGGYGMMGGGYGMMGRGGGYGMMPGAIPPQGLGAGPRRTLEEARTLADAYAARFGDGFAVAEVMEFERNFYAAIVETGTDRGAFELLIDPYTGAIGPEPGPNMMWNDKYGHMSFGVGSDNPLSMDEALDYARSTLQAQLPGSTVHPDGTSFYGYYTFDYDGSDGVIAGMLSVNAVTGDVWLHTWHGGFLAEWESAEASP
jgi:hypothetical protein